MCLLEHHVERLLAALRAEVVDGAVGEVGAIQGDRPARPVRRGRHPGGEAGDGQPRARPEHPHLRPAEAELAERDRPAVQVDIEARQPDVAEPETRDAVGAERHVPAARAAGDPPLRVRDVARLVVLGAQVDAAAEVADRGVLRQAEHPREVETGCCEAEADAAGVLPAAHAAREGDAAAVEPAAGPERNLRPVGVEPAGQFQLTEAERGAHARPRLEPHPGVRGRGPVEPDAGRGRGRARLLWRPCGQRELPPGRGRPQAQARAVEHEGADAVGAAEGVPEVDACADAPGGEGGGPAVRRDAEAIERPAPGERVPAEPADVQRRAERAGNTRGDPSRYQPGTHDDRDEQHGRGDREREGDPPAAHAADLASRSAGVKNGLPRPSTLG